MNRVLMFVLLLLAWLLLVWPFQGACGALSVPDVIVGALVALIAVAVMRDTEPATAGARFSPVRLGWLVLYALVMAYYIVKANLDVAYRVLHPAMPIHPGIVKVRTHLRTRAGLTALANSITLTPGTLTVSASPDGILYVHWINVKSTDEKEATRHIVERFEWFVKRIFE